MGIFGNVFDFDGDGKASLFEELLGLELLGFFDTDNDDEDEPVEYEYEYEDEDEGSKI